MPTAFHFGNHPFIDRFNQHDRNRVSLRLSFSSLDLIFIRFGRLKMDYIPHNSFITSFPHPARKAKGSLSTEEKVRFFLHIISNMSFS